MFVHVESSVVSSWICVLAFAQHAWREGAHESSTLYDSQASRNPPYSACNEGGGGKWQRHEREGSGSMVAMMMQGKGESCAVQSSFFEDWANQQPVTVMVTPKSWEKLDWTGL
ncbi:hypothetical protein F5148DRAFT_1152262 [Russula earlei]|uniref:Uncharacterized protein n=1 Tax=Russula earlei TaxID=71964 RepID=A0ACC0TZA5_9AGAM|nr:hypothetical protein F5148DRAFT_1152262 [Russula earlei]